MNAPATGDRNEDAGEGHDLEPRCDLLFVRGSVVTMDDERRVIEPGTVAIRGDRIVAVGPTEEMADWTARRTVDCAGSAVLPGFVDCHNHLFQALTRGLGDAMALWPWLCELIWPYAANISRQEAEISALLAAIEAARAGTTCILDNHYAPSDVDSTLAVASAIETVGLRGVVARGIFGPITDVAKSRDLPTTLFRYTAEEEIALTEACIGARPAGSRVAIWPAPINPTYVDIDLTMRAVELARRSGVRWHTHCSEVWVDTEVSRSRYGMAPMEWLDREGLLGTDTTIAHAIWLSEPEIELLGGTRTGVAHNPVANGYLASGVASIGELRRAGAVVALGTDGPGGGQRQDPFESMKAAVLFQRVTSLDPGALTAEDALELATREGARLLGTQAGSLSPGRLADVVVVDLQGAHVTPLHRSVSALVHSARASDVTMTVVGGEVVFEGGRCLRIDERAVIAEAQARANELIERLGLQHLRAPWRPSRAEGPAR